MKKKVTIEIIQRDVLLKALPHVVFDGWTKSLFTCACAETKHAQDMLDVAFPHGIRDLVICFARLMDEEMMTRLEGVDTADMRVRDKITLGIQTRLIVLEQYKEAERLAIGFFALPLNSAYGLKSLWKTADAIWGFAGDTSTDYNHYTKRGLLSGILSKTTLYWLSDVSENYQNTDEFIHRQVSRVLSLGKAMGRAKGFLDKVWNKTPFSSRKA